MVERVIVIDGLILSFFTKISHKFYRLTGRTNFFLAKTSLCIAVASLMTDVFGFWFPILSYKTDLVSIVIGASLSLFFLGEMHFCDKSDDTVFSDNRIRFFPEPIYSLWFRFSWFVLNIIITPIAIKNIFFSNEGIFVFKVLNVAYSPALFLFCYFILVDPPTPGKSKIREWIEAFSAGSQKLVPIKAEN